MAVPVIIKTQSNLAFALGQDFSFQLSASNYPTLWSLDARQVLPHGVVFSPLTGVLSGAGTTPGIWNLAFTAANADGSSSPEIFTMGFFETATSEVVKKALIHTGTWAVTLPDPAAARAASTTPVVTALAASAGQARLGDDITFQLAFTNGSLEYTPRLVAARFSMKGDDTLPPFFVTDPSAFKRSVEVSGGQYVTTFFLYASMESPELAAFLADYESEAGTEVNVMCEFELEFERPARASGPLTNRVTTQAFLLRVRRDMV